jgi:hypothetical protein
MQWDSTRPVPWKRLMREWVVYAGIMVVVFLLFFRDNGLAGALAGILVSGPLYLAVGGALAKLGYRRPTRGPSRATEASAPSSTGGPTGGDTAARGRPAPTRRTTPGPSNRPGTPRKRR